MSLVPKAFGWLAPSCTCPIQWLHLKKVIQSNNKSYLLWSIPQEVETLSLRPGNITYTDHSSLSSWERNRDLSERKDSWNETLCELPVKIIYLTGQRNIADAISRRPDHRFLGVTLLQHPPLATRIRDMCATDGHLGYIHKFFLPLQQMDGHTVPWSWFCIDPKLSSFSVSKTSQTTDCVSLETPDSFKNSCRNFTMLRLLATLELQKSMQTWGQISTDPEWNKTLRLAFQLANSARRTSRTIKYHKLRFKSFLFSSIPGRWFFWITCIEKRSDAPSNYHVYYPYT